MSLSGASMMQQKQNKFGVFAAHTAAYSKLPGRQTSKKSAETARFSAAC
jgi:hypothetical protein